MTAARLDLALIDSARAGEPDAIRLLLVRARSELRRYAQRSCFVSDVDDAVQESLLVLSRYLTSLRHAQAWSRWLFRIARQQCHRLARATLRHDLWDDEAVDRFVASRTEDDLRLDLVAAIESLPEPYRDVVVLRDFESLTIGEIARQLGLSSASVKGRLRRARELTREYLLGALQRAATASTRSPSRARVAIYATLIDRKTNAPRRSHG